MPLFSLPLLTFLPLLSLRITTGRLHEQVEQYCKDKGIIVEKATRAAFTFLLYYAKPRPEWLAALGVKKCFPAEHLDFDDSKGKGYVEGSAAGDKYFYSSMRASGLAITGI